MAKKWPPKDPDEVLEYGFNWTPRKVGEDVITVTTAEVMVGDVVVDSHDVGNVTDTEVLCLPGQGTVTWLSGGTAGTDCEILLRATTSSGRTLDQTMKIKIKDR
ncbi:MAG: hypothetical protein ACJ8DZ_14110 [Allosphingosinicella sp.]